ncbi:MAG: serine/threonine-protein kinase [Pyrinomonadaceae bacterium]
MHEGHVLGNYKFLELIGKGGQGKVYKALDTRLKRIVAIKVLSSDTQNRRSRLAAFLYEARLASSLDHPNICTVYALVEDEDHAFMVMEYIDGKNLFELAYLHPLTVESAVRIVLEVTTALRVAHERGIIHRDIKPRNVMVTSSGQVRILDFGLAKLLENADGSYETEVSYSSSSDDDEGFLEDIAERIGITREGVAQGTPSTSPPEMALGKPTDQRSDIFSTGVLLYLLLSGKYPFWAMTKDEVRHQVINEDPVPVSVARQADGSIPLSLIAIVIKALRKKPEERFQTIGDMHEALLAVLREIESSPGTKETSGVAVFSGAGSLSYAPRPGRRARRNEILVFSLIFILMMGLTLGLYFAFR